MFGDRGIHLVKGLAFGKIRQGGGLRLVLRLLLQGSAENVVDLTPALGEDAPPLSGEGLPAAGKGCRHRLVHIGLRNRAQQLPAHQQKDIALAHGQFG